MNSETQTFPPGGAWQRIGAKVVDYLVTGLIQCFFMFLAALVDLVNSPARVSRFLFVLSLGVFFTFVYFLRFGANGKMSIGYRLAGIRLEMMDGKPVPAGRNAVRALSWIVTASLLRWGGIIDFLWVLVNKQRRAGHDFAFKTRVVRVGKPRVDVITGMVLVSVTLLGLMLRDIIFPLPLRVFFIPSSSMANTLRINDRILVNLIAYRFGDPQNGDIAIMKAPKSALLSQKGDEDVNFVKRVVGEPGQVVEIVNRRILINGAPLTEPYALWDDKDFSYDMKIVGGAVYSREYESPGRPGPWSRNEILLAESDQVAVDKAKAGKVPVNSYLVLGDHRSNSNDSHVWGFEPRSYFRGRAILLFSPTSHWRNLD